MKRLALLAAVALAAISSPAQAQTIPYDGSVAQAVTNTLDAWAERAGFPDPQTKADFMADVELVHDLALTAALQGNPAIGWIPYLMYLGIPNPYPLGYGTRNDRGGSFGGGGASGSWDDPAGTDCDDYDYRLDPQGHILVPPLKLQGSGPMQRSGAPGYYWKGETDNWMMAGEYYVVAVTTPTAYPLWNTHMRNRYGVARPENAWWAVWAINGTSYMQSAPAFYVGTSLQNAEFTSAGTPALGVPSYAANNDAAVDCPQSDQGGDFHYYVHGGGNANSPWWSNCTMYAPNFSISSSGYYYSDHPVPIPKSYNAKFPQGLNDFVLACPLSPEVIRFIAEQLRRRVMQGDPPPGTPDVPVGPEDVRTGEDPPQLKDIGDPPPSNLPPPGEGEIPPPDDDDPPPPGTGYRDECDFGAGGCDNPNTPEPTLEDPPTGIMDPIFDWLPDLPSLTMPDMSSNCPVWHLNLTEQFGPDWSMLIDGHCQLVDYETGHGSVRSILSVLFVALWGLGAGVVILRA